jgi:ABC-type glycerol-3-phosphate transport system substrate-binding protein
MVNRRPFLLIGIAAIIASACGGRPGITPPASSAADQSAAASGSPGVSSAPARGTITVWTIAQGDDEVPIKAHEKAFEQANPAADVKIVAVPEKGYEPKITTALQAGNPPDVALLEPDIAATDADSK